MRVIVEKETEIVKMDGASQRALLPGGGKNIKLWSSMQQWCDYRLSSLIREERVSQVACRRWFTRPAKQVLFKRGLLMLQSVYISMNLKILNWLSVRMGRSRKVVLALSSISFPRVDQVCRLYPVVCFSKYRAIVLVLRWNCVRGTLIFPIFLGPCG